MSELAVSTEAVGAASGSVAASGGEFQARLDACRAVVESTIGSGWSGGAADAFAGSWMEWLEGASTIQDALRGMSRLLAEASAQYAATEGAVTQASATSHVTVTGGRSGQES